MTEEQKEISAERSNAFWNRIYLYVVLNTIVVIALLWGFGEMFRP